MRACIQRVREARVEVDGQVIGQIGPGLVVLLGVAEGDGEEEVSWMADKIVHLRIFSDPEGKMNLSLLDTQGEMLVISQFTLLGDCRKGRRPSFVSAARPEQAAPLYQLFCQQVAGQGVPVATGQFAADMQVALVNDGPVTLVVERSGESRGANC